MGDYIKCPNCGKMIRMGSILCEFCGHEALIVSDTGIIENDAIELILDEEKKEKLKKQKQEQLNCKNNKNAFVRVIWSKRKNRTIFIITSIAVIALAITLCFALSYTNYLSKAKSFDSKGQYEQAVECYKKAISKKSKDIEARVLLGLDYIQLEDYSSAKEILLEAYDIDSSNSDVIRALIKLYAASNDRVELNKLKASISDKELLKLFDTAMVAQPVFSVNGGTYGDDVLLELSSKESRIYYTLDGSSPNESNGNLYTQPISISDGNTTVKAVCVDDNGNKSLIAEENYKVSYKGPSSPSVTPDGGTYSTPTTITISADEGCEIYYTWDKTTPSASSSKYTGPIEIIEGNNVLSVICIDKHDMISDVVRCNFVYNP